MKLNKILVRILSICSLCFMLCACGVKHEEVIGTWGGSYTYNGNEFTQIFVLDENFEYGKLTYKNGYLSGTEMGSYEIKGNKIELEANGKAGTTVYEYKNGKLYNNDHEFYMLED